jgi:hypothetical protein
MTLVTASLYLLCLAYLFGSAVFIYFRNPRSGINAHYSLLALALMGWVGTLFVFDSLPPGGLLLNVGRENFAAAALVGSASYLFVTELAGERPKSYVLIWTETLALAAVSLFTPLIDKSEAVQSGQHLTTYGPLFAVYIVHVVAYLASAIYSAFRSRNRLGSRTKLQLRLVGTGILATAVVGITANIVLPYLFGDFRFIDVGTLSTILVLGGVTYAIFTAHLFNIRVIVTTALVFAVLISIFLEVYNAAVSFLAELLPVGDPVERHFAATVITLVISATTSETIKRGLHRLGDKILRKGEKAR